jgi:Tol biopolymer transport system component
VKLRAVPFVAVGIAGLLAASIAGAVVVAQDDDDSDTIAADATTTSSFPPFEDSTTTSLPFEQSAAATTVVPPVSVAPVPPASASTTSSLAAGPQPTLAVDPAPCQAPPAQPAAGAPVGASGVHAVTLATGAVRLTNAIGRLPAWRPKTDQVVSVSVTSGKPPGLCLSAPNGGGSKAITTPVGAGRPALSLDGSRLAVRSGRPGVADIVVFAVEGADQKVIFTGDVSDPVWLGNGTAVVACAAVSGGKRLVAVPAGGGEPRVLRDSCPASPISSSPDGTRIAFSQGNLVTVLNTTTRAATSLKIGTVVSTLAAPSWAPDGKQVAFAYANEQEPALGIFDVDAGKATTPFRAPGLVSPAWAPAGDTIAFLGTEGSGLALFSTKPDGSARKKVAGCQSTCVLAAQPFSSDGASVAVEATGTAA